MHPKGAKTNIVDQAIFSNDGPNLKSPAATSTPSVIPKIYKLKKSKAKGKPKSSKDIPKSGEVNNIAVGVILTCAILYDFLFRTSIGFNMLFLEEIWSRNFTNLFIAPIKISEIIISVSYTHLRAHET